MKTLAPFFLLALLLASCDSGDDDEQQSQPSPVSSLPEMIVEGDVCSSMADERLKSYCYRNFDADGDKMISEKEASEVREMEVDVISDFRGIQYFTGLTSLTTKHGAFTELDLSHQTNLVSLTLENDSVRRLDLSHSPNLKDLSVKSCKGLASIGLTACTNMHKVELNGIDALQTLSLPTSKSASLTFLIVSGHTMLKSLKVPSYLQSLETDGVENIDMSQAKELFELNIDNNEMQSLKTPASLQLLSANYCPNLASVDFSASKVLATVYLAKRKGQRTLSAIDLSKNTNLNVIDVSNNNLRDVDLSNLPHIMEVYAGGNDMEELDFSRCIELKRVWAANCPNLKAIKVNFQSYSDVISEYHPNIECDDGVKLVYLDDKGNDMRQTLVGTWEMTSLEGYTQLNSGEKDEDAIPYWLSNTIAFNANGMLTSFLDPDGDFGVFNYKYGLDFASLTLNVDGALEEMEMSQAQNTITLERTWWTYRRSGSRTYRDNFHYRATYTKQ